LTALNSIAVKLVFPAAAVGTAFVGELNAWGLFNTLRVPNLLAGMLSLVLLDLTIYTQHFLFHKVPPFWRVHRMHHTDLDIDVTTGARFHTIEIVVSMVIKISMVIILGSPAWSVLFFEILLNATSMFNHSNIRIHIAVDGFLRKMVVTPDMHRVHHSVIIEERTAISGSTFHGGTGSSRHIVISLHKDMMQWLSGWLISGTPNTSHCLGCSQYLF